jgi:hypothetical protein
MSKDTMVNINNIDWDIKYVPENCDVLDGCRGMCVYRSSTIYVTNSLKPSEKLRALFHEIAHATLAETDYNIEIKEALGNSYEKFITLLGDRISDIGKQYDILYDSLFKTENE